MYPPSVRGLRIGYRCLGVLRAFLELFCHHLTNLHHHARQLILTPTRDLPRPLQVGRDLIPQGSNFFWLERTGVRQDRFCVIKGLFFSQVGF